MSQADRVNGIAWLRYRETQPGRLFRQYAISADVEGSWNFGGVRTYGSYVASASATLRNYMWINLNGWVDQRSQSDRLTRGGPLMGTTRAPAVIAEVGNNRANAVSWSGRVYYGWSADGGWVNRLSGGVTVRPGPRWELSLTPNWLQYAEPRQYVTTLDGGRAETFGRRYVFARIRRSELTTQLRLAYAFTPDLTLELYAEPFASSGRWSDYGELPAPGSRTLRRYGTDGTTATPQPDGSVRVTDGTAEFTVGAADFHLRSFRSNAVLRWEWHPGSTLYVVWQQNRSGDLDDGGLIRPADLWRSLGAPGDHILAVKATYWLGLH
jgi:hypothetical protein